MAAPDRPTLLLCHAAPPDDLSAAERMIECARAACLRDTALRAQEAGFARILIAATDPSLFADLPDAEIVRTDPQAPIGEVVADIAPQLNAPLVYAGSGMPAMTAADWRELADAASDGLLAANNLHSCDVAAVPDGRMLDAVRGEPIDNRFALLLRDAHDLEAQTLERSARTLFDLDTPTDLAALSLGTELGLLAPGAELAAALDRCQAELTPLRERLTAAWAPLTRRDAEVMLIGRLNPHVWARLDADTSCRVRVLSEERGLRARSTGGAHAPRTLPGLLMRRMGPMSVIAAAAQLADAVWFDTRPLLAQLGWGQSRADRFAADLGWIDQIADHDLRRFAEAAWDAPIPFALGGQTLVGGAALLAIDAAWTRLERESGRSGRIGRQFGD